VDRLEVATAVVEAAEAAVLADNYINLFDKYACI